METWPRAHRLSVDEYYRMAEVGLLAPDARVELIEGVIIDMPPIGSRHGWTVAQIVKRLNATVGDTAEVFSQSALRLGRFSEPQPDVLLLQPRGRAYRKAHPAASDVLLVIEVSDTTLRYDLERKAPLYARHAVPEIWVIDVNRDELHVFRDPQDGGYRDVAVPAAPGTMPLPIPGATLDLSDLWGD